MLPSGGRLHLDVIAKIPYLTVGGQDDARRMAMVGAPGQVDFERWIHVFLNSSYVCADVSALGGPPIGSVVRRVVLDLHTREVLSDVKLDGVALNGRAPSKVSEQDRDLLLYVYFLLPYSWYYELIPCL